MVGSMCMKKNISQIISNNFEKASTTYNNNADIQKVFALSLAKYCTKIYIPKGVWIDLGAGTGLLADALETLYPNQNVIRVDNSPGMLAQNKKDSPLLHWDLNKKLPILKTQPTLLASSFALHWLANPSLKIKEWFQALAPNGWLALSVPIQGSFPEWQLAAKKAALNWTGLKLPSRQSLLKEINPKNLKLEKTLSFVQHDKNAISLLKQIVHLGAHYTPTPSLSVGEWRRLQKEWPRPTEEKPITLSWKIQLLLIQK